jgi:hypothetical protein
MSAGVVPPGPVGHDRVMAYKPVRATVTLQRAAELAAEARDGLARLRDPALRLRRRQRRARWGVALRALPTAVIGALAVQAILAGNVLAGGCMAAVAAGGGWVTAATIRRAWRLHRLPVPMPRPARPPRGSAARPAVDRLDAQQVALGQLVGLLGPAGSDAAAAADEAVTTLRWCAARVVAVEAAPGSPRATWRRTDPAVAALVSRLEVGVAGHGQLVRAAAAAVAASEGLPDAFTRQRVEDETDRLRGLALGLAELDPGR